MALAELPNVDAQNLATIEIVQPSTPKPMIAIADKLDSLEWAIFNSVNAVTTAVPLWGSTQRPKHIAAIGPTTAQALQMHHCHVDVIASPPCSEGLVNDPAFNSDCISHKHIAIFCGENPKPLLFQQLRKRDAIVEPIYCYRRQCAQPTVSEIEKIIASPIQVIVCASLESMINLFHIFAPTHVKWLLSKQFIVINRKMQTLAIQMGCLKSRVHVSENATNTAIVATLQALSV